MTGPFAPLPCIIFGTAAFSFVLHRCHGTWLLVLPLSRYMAVGASTSALAATTDTACSQIRRESQSCSHRTSAASSPRPLHAASAPSTSWLLRTYW